MIIELTKSDHEKIKHIEEKYDRLILEIQDRRKKISPTDTPELQYISLPKIEDEVLFYKLKFSSKLEAVSFTTFSKKNKIDMTSEDVNLARKQIQFAKDAEDAVNSLLNEFEEREFLKLNNDKEKILLSAEEQINRFVDINILKFQRIIKTQKNQLGRDIRGFADPLLRYSEKLDDLWLDATEVYEKSKESLLKRHYEALHNNPEALKELDTTVFKTISENPKISSDKGIACRDHILFFPQKRKSRSKKELPTFSENSLETFFMFSTTNAKNTIYDFLSSKGDTETAANKINTVSKKKIAKISSDKNRRAIRVETKNTLTTVELLIPFHEKIKSRGAKKILHFIENELYQRVYFKGNMNDNVVSFPLQKLVDKRLYSTVANARRAFNDAGYVLTAIRLNINEKSKNGKNDISVSDGGYIMPFSSMLIENGQCLVRLNEDVNWAPLLKDFFLMPDSWWALPDNASDLEYKVFRQARLNAKKIKNGILSFNISLKSIAAWLNLPLNTKNPKRNVKQPIETAVDQINQSLDPKGFKMKINTDLNAPIKKYLDGYLEIKMTGIYTNNLIGIRNKNKLLIEKKIKKKEEIIEKASVLKLAESMKNEK